MLNLFVWLLENSSHYLVAKDLLLFNCEDLMRRPHEISKAFEDFKLNQMKFFIPVSRTSYHSACAVRQMEESLALMGKSGDRNVVAKIIRDHSSSVISVDRSEQGSTHFRGSCSKD